jgi:NADH:ubiquinone oxidoreductase subunit 6 (subunit J)
MKYLFPILFLVFLMFPLFVNAQLPFGDSCTQLEVGFSQTHKLCMLLQDIRDVLYILGLAGAVLVIIIGGIMYMTAGADESKVGNAKKTITYGIVGVIIIAASAFIIGVVDEVIVGRLTQ